MKTTKKSPGSIDPHLAVSYWPSAEGKQKGKSIEDTKKNVRQGKLYLDSFREVPLVIVHLFIYLFWRLHSKSTWPENL